MITGNKTTARLTGILEPNLEFFLVLFIIYYKNLGLGFFLDD